MVHTVPALSIICEAFRGTVVPSGDVCAEDRAEKIRRVRRHRNSLTMTDPVRIGLLV
jgi:hypothetical protein